jgi:hypothetical protein
MAANFKFVLLDGLSYIEQAEFARDYEKRSGRAFRCAPCLAASARTKAAEEPASEVVAVLVGDAGELTPLCEACYERLVEEQHESGLAEGAANAVRG